MIAGIPEALAKGLMVVLSWMTGYSRADTSKGREQIDDQKKIDEFNQKQSESDLVGVRRDLSDDAPIR